MRTRTYGCTILSALALLVAGCGGGSGADAEAVAWTDDVCGALSGFTLAAARQPRIDRTNPAAAVQGVSDYLASTSDGLQQSITALDAVGHSPVDGGDEYVARLGDTLARIRTSFEAARTQLASVDTTSPEVLATALPAATAPLQELRTMPSPTEGLGANEALRTASEQAVNCQQLRSVSSPAG
ncbi:hypothetical protein GCM10009609_04370 [Pseudonocardia aurantiaca]|uniref:Small secreted protein n=1 Tax=Pseudonocardia aurantiaca TaxID=75290 RepID=A0ABW4FM57_9PSEU